MTKTKLKYSEALATKICDQIAMGKSLRTICKPAHFPGHSTVILWLSKYDDFAKKMALAREEQADYYADEMIEIADSTNDPAKARVQIDTRKWIACKLKPKKYGDTSTTKLEAVVAVVPIDTDTDPASAAEIYKQLVS